jgi:hypothetical protein
VCPGIFFPRLLGFLPRLEEEYSALPVNIFRYPFRVFWDFFRVWKKSDSALPVNFVSKLESRVIQHYLLISFLGQEEELFSITC